MSGSLSPQNQLLSSFSADALKALAVSSPIRLARGEILGDAGEPIVAVYFPQNAVVSLLTLTEEGKQVESATIGREGFVGFETLMAGRAFVRRAIVQVAGLAIRVDLSRFTDCLRDYPVIRSSLLRFIRALIIQLMQTAACNSIHGIEARCCRWLLMAHDRAARDTFELTQEFLAAMLGTRRATVGVVAQSLRSKGLIEYRRGVLTVSDRAGLERAACECYRVVRAALQDHPARDSF